VSPDSAGEARVLQLINGERAQAGLPMLRLNGGASSVARAWSNYIARSGLQHNPNLSRDLQRAGVTGWSTAGENVGDGGSVDQVHGLFMGSGTHRNNILSSQFTEVGVGVVVVDGHVWVTTDFIG
jgi:uncharacterized protein YkwD